jgi:glycosyltransferase involved in cell wall biosynthesis
MKIIINTPLINLPGGVSNHYLGLRRFFSSDIIYNQQITKNYLRRKCSNKYFISIARCSLFSYEILKFIFLIIFYNRPNILLNPSFYQDALKRDLIYLRISKFLGCKVGVFIHGWNQQFLEGVRNGNMVISKKWLNADLYIVLGKIFQQYLQDIGIKAPIYLTSTKVDDDLVNDINLKRSSEIINLLFLGRVEKEKGIIITIKAFQILSEKYSNLHLNVVGDGTQLEIAKLYVKKEKIHNVVFTGALSGEKLKLEFRKADIYVLPTYHGEGMPTSVLEAMAFGLPVISRPVGGLIDFFEDGKMGYLIESTDPELYSQHIEKYIHDKKLYMLTSEYNKTYAHNNFLASRVAYQLESILHSF